MWKNILGHKRELEQIQRALAGKKVPHAYLFCGIEGIGKYRIACALAKALDCKSDLHLIEPQGKTIKIETIRELKSKIYLHPLEGKTKVVIIDMAEAMTEAAANALLKILEEPPTATHFILISSQPTKLLPTIRSRCQKLEFSPLPAEEIEKLLISQGMTTDEAAQKARFANGSIKAALDFDGELFESIRNQLADLMKAPKPSQIFNLSETWIDEEEKIPLILNALNHFWHQKIVETKNPAKEEVLMGQWSAIQNARRSLETYANKQLLMENLLFTLTQ